MNHGYILLLQTEITNTEIRLSFSYYSWAQKEQEPAQAAGSGLRSPPLRHRSCVSSCFCHHLAHPARIITLCIFALSMMRINGVSFCLGKQFIHLRWKVSQLSVQFTHVELESSIIELVAADSFELKPLYTYPKLFFHCLM